jgi:prevent-host-death family protein
MKSWPVQDAKNQLSAVIELAETQGHGKPVVVMMAAAEFKKLTLPKETPLQFFSRFAGAGIDWKRQKDLPPKSK